MDEIAIRQRVQTHLARLLELGRELVANRAQRQFLANSIEHQHRLKISEIARCDRTQAEKFDAAAAPLVIALTTAIRAKGVGVVLEDRPGWPTTGEPHA